MKTISVPFRFDEYGNVASSSDPRRIWANRVKSVMGTPTGQRVMRPEFGSDLPSNIFSASVAAPGYIETVVNTAARQWLSGLEVVDVVVGEDVVDNEMSVEFVYRIPEALLEDEIESVRIL